MARELRNDEQPTFAFHTPMKIRIDFDGAWKEALDVYLRPLMELCFPGAARQIDWNTPVEPLDQELQKIARGGGFGPQRVDKLVRVRAIGGVEEWVLVHMEMQAQRDPGLAQRVYRYHHRIVDRFNRRTATLVLLGDEVAAWRPSSYEQELWGCRLRFEYPVCKLLDFARDRKALEDSSNPAAVVIAAHLAAQESRRNMDLRKRWKWQLVRRLYERGYATKDVHELFRLIDWFMALPDALEDEFKHELKEFEMQKNLPHLTSIERSGIRIGRQEGTADVIVRLARKRFPAVDPGDETAIRKLSLSTLEELSEALLDFDGIADLRDWLGVRGEAGNERRT